jgi:endogenous inhibitor of DNA gyrase (YacG/DUF329 family)
MAPYDHDGDAPAGGGSGKRSGPRCPICGSAAVARYRPFCSKRCADVDLHRWLAGVYRVPTSERPESEGGRDEGKE